MSQTSSPVSGRLFVGGEWLKPRDWANEAD